uniref:FACT complex subunit POB3 n=1 Tax=Anthurium amnicola TaxID=1678845 RepID=A0A1D1XTT0_9ARAE
MATSLLTSYLNPPMTGHHICIPSRGIHNAFTLPHLCPAAPTLNLGRGTPGRGQLSHLQRHGTRRWEGLVARAGPPSSSVLILAFVFPLSLIIGTIFASIRIADQLDEKYLQELAMNKAIMEEKEAEDESEDELGEDEDDEAAASKDEQLVSTAIQVTSAAPRSRNRPKREA